MITNIVFVLLATALVMPVVFGWRKDYRARRQLERRIDIVRDIAMTDDGIYHGRCGSDEWIKGPDARALVHRRMRLHEEYCDILNFRPICETLHVNELMRLVCGG